MKKRISRWLLALFATVLVLASLVGCSGSDVNEALDVAIEVLEVVESLEAEESGSAAVDDELAVLEESQRSSDESITASAEISEEAAETESEEAQTPEAENTDREELAQEEDALTIKEDGHYTSKEEVALYIHTYGKLPSNFISKDEAEDLGWKKKDGEAGQLHVVAPGMSIGGSYFGNYEGLLPEKKGRKYYECDINYVKGNRGAERIVYSNDGLIFYTGDHYESFEQLYPVE
ncbi:MAG: ribonuclease [Lachnospiraceae bacterium]|nr:ribonuclease [Lachnospiraceae bacterium]